MIKRIIIASTFITFLSLGTVALAQITGISQLTAEKLEAFKKEPPLSQGDVDAYVKIMPEMAKYRGQDPDSITPEDRKSIEQIVTDVGLSDVRSILVFSKISLGMLALGGAPLDMFTGMEIPAPLIPTEDDVELLKKNQPALEKLVKQYGG